MEPVLVAVGFDVGALISSDLDQGYLRSLVVVVPIDDAAHAKRVAPVDTRVESLVSERRPVGNHGSSIRPGLGLLSLRGQQLGND
jgi:hypothetical protein